jgi:hypothetical protein
MSNYYTQFSFEILVKNEDEKKWCEERLGELSKSFLGEGIEDTTAAGYDPDRGIGFAWTTKYHDDAVNIFSDENGEPLHAALFFQEYLKKFDPLGDASFEWACHGDDMDVGGFSGGGVFITAKNLAWFYPGEQIRKAAEMFEKKTKKARTRMTMEATVVSEWVEEFREAFIGASIELISKEMGVKP